MEVSPCRHPHHGFLLLVFSPNSYNCFGRHKISSKRNINVCLGIVLLDGSKISLHLLNSSMAGHPHHGFLLVVFSQKSCHCFGRASADIIPTNYRYLCGNTLSWVDQLFTYMTHDFSLHDSSQDSSLVRTSPPWGFVCCSTHIHTTHPRPRILL